MILKYMLCCLLLQVNYGILLKHDCQEVDRKTLMCTNFIPENLPEEIEHVKITNIMPKRTPIKNDSFHGHTWSFIKSLWIQTVDEYESYIPYLSLYNNTFSNLFSLETLTVYMPALEEIEPDAFRGLNNLTEMNFLAIRRTSIFYLLLILENTESMSNIQTLRINQLNTYGKPPTILTVLEHTFFQAISLRNISALHLTHMPVAYFDFKSSLILCDRVRLVNLTRTTIFKIVNRTSTTCTSLDTVTLKKFTMNTKSTHLHFENKNYMWKIYNKYYFFKNAQKLNIDFWFTDFSTIINTTLKIESQEFQLRELSMKNSKLNYIDLVLVTKAFVNIEKVELQSNYIKYLSSGSFKSTPLLKALNLSDNELGRMQTMNTSSFAKMFSPLKNLQILDLSRNGLSYIPMDTFNENKELMELHIRNNNIEQIALEATFSLSFIDLSYNKISYLNKASCKWFDKIFSFHFNKSKFDVDIGNNPFQCICKHQDFLQWLVQSPLVKDSSSHDVVCINHEHDKITPQLTNNLNEECERPIIIRNIALASSTGFVVAAAVIAAVIIAYRRHRIRVARERTIEEIIAQIQDGQYRFQFPLFLSFASEDCELVMQQIYQPLLNTLRNILDTPNELVCLGDSHFTPGRSIIEEIQRCLDNSALVIFVVSNEFCLSQYCRNEFEQACTMEKPTLLLFVEEVNENDMPPLMTQYFRKYTRANMRYVNGEFLIVPSWERICQSVLEMLPR